MITQFDVIQFVKTKSSITENVFQSIVVKNREDKAVVFATDSAKALMKSYGRAHSLLSVVDKDSLDFLKTMTIDEVETIAETESRKVDNSLFSWIVVKPFAGLWIQLGGYVYGLDAQVLADMRRNDKDAYGSVNDGVFWAGFYFLLER